MPRDRATPPSDACSCSVRTTLSRREALLGTAALALAGCPAAPPRAPPAPARVELDLPPRSVGALAGSAFAETIRSLVGHAREQAIVAQIEGGNVPPFLRSLVPVALGVAGGSGEATVWVAPDYLAVGSDDDCLRVPLTAAAAQRIADRVGCVLPTRRLVDAIYAQAPVKLEPVLFVPSPEMVLTEAYERHNARIETQLRRRGATRGVLIAGHKKDIVIGRELAYRPGKVAIYGLYRLGGEPIQPLSFMHDASYVDYSHGVRLVHDQVKLGGALHAIADILRSEATSTILSDEGPIAELRYR